MEDTEPVTCQDQADRVRDEVAELVMMPADTEPQQHLALAADLREDRDRIPTAALGGGMNRARQDGWGLRRIAAASPHAHLANAAKGRPPATMEPGTGPSHT
ncbi:hypothetical protein [Streptomyces bohaiensis]|uniref:Uncharacterized protein n=1 Tax=Streptomyces bohaiensis TaxID=1431344 RepID=A0ABX1CIF2_9ACTN|nr:hypothetical protein [Streptomyces bohaiensis]NJQ16942.1 hypothetical protein [Streptomyces bohaiensis]